MLSAISEEFRRRCFEVDVLSALRTRRELPCEDQQSHRGVDVYSSGVVPKPAAGLVGARSGSWTASYIGDEQEHATVEGNITHSRTQT